MAMHICHSMHALLILPCARVKLDPLALEDCLVDLDRRQVLEYSTTLNPAYRVVCGGGMV